MISRIPMLSPTELLEIRGNPWSRDCYSPVGDHACLLVDVTQAWPTDDVKGTTQFLMDIPCPTIGVGPCAESACPARMLDALDTVVNDQRELAAILRNVTAHPLAAATLTQVLRHNEAVSAEAGVLAESLAYATLQGSRDFRAFLASQRPTTKTHDDTPPLLTSRDGDVLKISLNSPARRNAYSAAMRDTLFEALRWLDADTSLARAEIRGEGDCFCVGGDLSEFGMATDPAEAHSIRMSRPVGLLIHRLRHRIEFHVHRACIGSGIELPAFAGRVTATADTFFQLPEIAMGLIPGAGGTVGILNRIGKHRLVRWALSGRRLRADTALAWGLIDAID